MSVDRVLEAIIQQVRKDPDDLAARMVLADAWLERGDPQGQLMVWTTRLESMTPLDEEFWVLTDLCQVQRRKISHALGRKYGLAKVQFKHGYVHHIAVHKLAAWKVLDPNHAPELALVQSAALDMSSVRRKLWLASPFLSQLSALKLCPHRLDCYVAYEIENCNALCNLTSLDLEGNTSFFAGARDFLHSPILKNLTSLCLNRTGLFAEHAYLIADSPVLQNLTYLDLSNNILHYKGLCALFKSPYLKLKDLRFSGNRVGYGINKSSSYTSCPNELTHLDLSRNGLDINGMQILADSSLFRHASSLVLSGNDLEAEKLQVLASSNFSEKLTNLEVLGSEFDAKGVDVLTKSERFQDLTSISVSCYGWDLPMLSSFCNADFIRNIESLSIYFSKLADRGLERLIASKHLQRLKNLDVNQNNLTDQSALRIANSSNFQELSTLDISSNKLRAKGILALSNSPKLKMLRLVEAWRNDLSRKEENSLFSNKVITKQRFMYLSIENHYRGLSFLPLFPIQQESN
jgi:hypothetical protein